MIRHILIIKFKDSVSPKQITDIKALFHSTIDKIEGVSGLEWGVNNSTEQRNQGYTHAVVMTFDNEAARDYYLPHPEHDALKAEFRPLLEDIIVFDYDHQ